MALVAAGAVALAVVSGGSSADPRTPAELPGLPPPFLGTVVAGSGGLTAAIDAYGDVVDLRAPGPAGRGLIDNPADRQAAGSVAATTGIVPRVQIGGGTALPLWRADSVEQRYLPGTNAVRTIARFGRIRVAIGDAAAGGRLERVLDVSAPPGTRVRPAFGVNLEGGAHCREEREPGRLALVCSASRPSATARSSTNPDDGSAAGRLRAGRVIEVASAGDRHWIGRARPLGSGAPRWARRMYRRSLLTLRALTDQRTGAVAAGARDGWAYVWPRDASAAALAFAAAGYRPQARRVARFLRGLDLGAAARFRGDGAPVGGRGVQGDASGWVAVAARAAGLPSPPQSLPWRDRADYQESDPGSYLANATASVAASAGASAVDGPQIRLYGGKSAHRQEAAGIERAFETPEGLVRRAGDPASGLDSAAAWAVRPFPIPALYPPVRRTLLRLAGTGAPGPPESRFGITPGERWPGVDPWTAPTAWSAWSLAALADRERRHPTAACRERRAALSLLADLRRAATPAGALPERVDARTGVPRSTTPLAWSHAFAILALRELWP
jgi:glucoamylase